jgi:hypothetical protein
MPKLLKLLVQFFSECVDALAADDREHICRVPAGENADEGRWRTYLVSRAW